MSKIDTIVELGLELKRKEREVELLRDRIHELMGIRTVRPYKRKEAKKENKHWKWSPRARKSLAMRKVWERLPEAQRIAWKDKLRQACKLRAKNGKNS